MKYVHPTPIKMYELYLDLFQDGKKIVFVWVLDHAGITGNSTADSAARDALDGNVSDDDDDSYLLNIVYHAENGDQNFVFWLFCACCNG